MKQRMFSLWPERRGQQRPRLLVEEEPAADAPALPTAATSTMARLVDLLGW